MKKFWIIALLAVLGAVGGLYVYQQQSSAPGMAGSSATAEIADAALPEILADDHVIGSADAPVTMIEYASLTCPHCAAFHTDTLPQIKANYIDKGLVRLVFRHFPLNQPALAGAQLAECLPDAQFFAAIDLMFSAQAQWAGSGDPMVALAQLAATLGVDQAGFEACVNDKPRMEDIIARAKAASETFKIESTPSFIINGTLVSGALPYEEFEKVLNDKLP